MQMFCVLLNKWIDRAQYDDLCSALCLRPTGAYIFGGWPEMMDSDGLIFDVEY